MKRGAKLGQHFLHNARYARILATSLTVRENETILEIGPGKGMLTRELLQLGRVIAIEKDESLLPILHETFFDDIRSKRLTIVHDDVRNVLPNALGLTAGEYVLGANIPYYITGEIIRQFLSDTHPPRTMSLLIQKEVAQRIISKKESLLSLSVKAYGVPRIVATVSAGNFTPSPSVDSAIIAIEHISKDRFDRLTEQQFFAVLRAGFSAKRKTILNTLSSRFSKEMVIDALSKNNISEKARAETLSLEQWLSIASLL